MIKVENVGKTFTLFNQENTSIPVIKEASFEVLKGDCVALVGKSGSGKSTLMRMIYGNYLTNEGKIWVGETNIVGASSRAIINIRRHILGYVSQFLRVVPRVPTREVVAEPLLAIGKEMDEAFDIAEKLLERLNIPPALWDLSPTTFSGGEQQRVNIARGFIRNYPAILLDEPTASLDSENRSVVLDLIKDAKSKGTAIVGIFHDESARMHVCDWEVDVSNFSPKLES